MKKFYSKNKHSQQLGNSTILFVAIGLIAILIGIFVQTGTNKPKEFPEFSKMIVFPNAKAINHSLFTDHEGKRFGEAQLKGKWSILFFGFTNCPDICPTTLQTLKQVKQTLAENSLWNNYQVIMVSVDPEIDTVERLSNYVPYFDSEFIGIVNNAEITTQFAKQLGILFVKRQNDSSHNYEVDHSASLILLNPDGQWAGVIGAPHKANEISADLKKLATFVGPIKQTNQAQTIKEKSEDSTSNQHQTVTTNSNLDELTITDAWIRPAPPSATSLAAYFEIQNNSDKDINIVDSNSPAFDLTMIHNTVIEDGVARMEHMDGLEIPANGRVTLAPLGTHMMLMRPETALNFGYKIDITLIDENDNEYHYQVPVRQQPTK